MNKQRRKQLEELSSDIRKVEQSLGEVLALKKEMAVQVALFRLRGEDASPVKENPDLGISALGELKAAHVKSHGGTGITGTINDLRSIAESLRDEEQEYFDNMPESLQTTDKGTNAEQSVSDLDEAISGLEDAENLLSEALDAEREVECIRENLKEVVERLSTAADNVDNSISY